MAKSIPSNKNKIIFNIAMSWGAAFVVLVFYYGFIEIPMERSFVKGLQYLEQKKAVEAAAEFKKILAVYPKYEPVFLNMALFYQEKKQMQEAKAQYNLARRLCFINSEIFSVRGLVYAKYRGKLKEGVAFYNGHVLKNYASRFLVYERKK